MKPTQADFVTNIVLENKRLKLKLESEKSSNTNTKDLSIFDTWVWFYGILITTVATFYRKVIESISDSVLHKYAFWQKKQ